MVVALMHSRHRTSRTSRVGRRNDRSMDSVPSQLGGKRRLLPEIAKMMPSREEAPSLVDPFCGSCSVSLWAKRRGLSVLAADISERSYVTAKALVENDRVRLDREDLARLFAHEFHGIGFVEQFMGGTALPSSQCRFLDGAFAVARKMPEPKRSLTLLLLLRFVVGLRPMANWGAKRIVRQLELKEFDAVNPKFLRDRLLRTVEAHPLPELEKLRTKVNRGVFSNGKANRANRDDAIDIVSQTQASILYLDPPYPNTVSYERSLRPLDSILAGEMVKVNPSRFSDRNAVNAMEELLESSRHFPMWIISYGNRVVSSDDLKAFVSRFKRHVEVKEIRYVHLASLASKESKEANRELLVRAWGDR